MTQCTTKFNVGFHPKLPLEITFDAPEISFDGGLIALRQADDSLGLTNLLSRLIPDERDATRIMHSRQEQLRQRIYQIAMGYEDCNDADTLRYDRMFKVACDVENMETDTLSSQPTLSRLSGVKYSWGTGILIVAGHTT